MVVGKSCRCCADGVVYWCITLSTHGVTATQQTTFVLLYCCNNFTLKMELIAAKHVGDNLVNKIIIIYIKVDFVGYVTY
jgi:hypothetical protein